MEKENGEANGGDGSSKGNDASSLLDAASLFGAYWGRDPSALLGSAYGAGAGSFGLLGAAAAAAAAQGAGGGAGGGGSGSGPGGGGGGRYPPTSTLSVAASQAASLGLHPAASAAWWSMASQLAAQDYLARLQASGLGGFPPGSDPYGLAAGLAGAQSSGGRGGSGPSQAGQGGRGRPPGASRAPHNRTSHSTTLKDKDKGSMRSSYGLPKTSSPSMSSMSGMPSGLSALGLNSLAGSRTPTLSSASPQPLLSSSSSSKHSRKSSSSAAAKASALSGAYLAGVSGKNSSSTSGGSVTGSSNNNNASSPSPSSSMSSAMKDKDLSSMMRSDLLMAQAAMAQNAYQAAVAQGKGGKGSSALFGNPFGLGSLNSAGLSDKDRHSGLDSLANLPHTILSAALEGNDGASILGGVRLPPDTEIIKYTSSIVGPKVRKVPGTTNRGRKKTISLDPPHVSVHPALSSTGLLVERGGPAKKPKLDSEYGHLPLAHQNSSASSVSITGGASSASNSDRVEVIKLPSSSSDPRSSTPFSMSSYTGLSKELLQSIANQSGLNLAALEKQFAQQFGSSSSYSKSSSSYSASQDVGLNLSSKPSHSSSQPQRDESPASTANDDDAPLNLSLKPSSSSNKASTDEWRNSSGSTKVQDEAASSLSSLSSITASLGSTRSQPPPPDRVSRRKPGAKPRRVIQESSPSPSHPPGQESPTPSGSEDSDMGPWHSTKEGRPRNLGRGVSKPKKNTVASLLAQSRALGIRPALAHQYLQDAVDLLNPELQEKLKAAMGDISAGLIPPPELSGTDSDGGPPGSDSCADDSDTSDALAAEPMLRLPLAMGWRRETLMKGLSRNCSIKGDVTYYPPEPHSNIKLKNIQELMSYLEKNPSPPLQKENFSYSSRPLIGKFLQSGGQEGMSETEVAKRLDEARRALGSACTSSLAVEQRIELARQQQAAREARKDAAKGREQARLAREQERSEKAELAKREKEARTHQLMEARRKRQEDLEKQKQEDQSRKQQERELKRQQAVLLKEQMYMAEVGKQRELIYTVELERERRRQHMALVKQLDGRRRFEERERRKHRLLLDKLALKEKKLEQRKKEMELLKELRKPQEDSTLSDQKSLPTLNRIPGLKLPGQAMADILMVFEFIHNFGQTLGFDMDTLPTLNTLQMALLPDCCTDAEEELLSILTHLLVCAIEDPGIPHPGRHTTILGHALRTNEITPGNVSEVLRIYLYANATGEIKSLTGINPERDREKRVADHHQSDSEVQQQPCHGRNSAYYTHLHSNPTWRLAEKLRHHPYLALNPTCKARILAILCDELLQSKPVLRQIDASLENLNQLRKDRYLMDAKLRKIKMLHNRKQRIENAEKQQALALERMQKMVEDSEMAAVSAANSILNTINNQDGIEQNNGSLEDKVNDLKKSDDSLVNHNDASELDSVLMGAPPLKDVTGSKESVVLELVKANGTKDILDKDSVIGDGDMMLSDVESEGTQPEEDEDKNLTAEELSRKLEKFIRQSDAQLQNLIAGAHSLRATCYGQDRYWRRYWSLNKCGGIFVEAMESTQPEIMIYHEKMEEGAKKREEGEAANRAANRKSRNKKGQKIKSGSDQEAVEVACMKNSEQLLQNELELRNIKSELNLSDHTRIIKYEPNMGHKIQGSPIKMEEKHIQQQKVAEDHLLDIEDSIPTAFLVQKPQTNERKPGYGIQVGAGEEKNETSIKYENSDVKLESNVKNEINDSQMNSVLDVSIKPENKDGIYMNNLEELKKLAESVVPPKENSQSEVKQEGSPVESVKEEKVEIKDELNDPESASNFLTTKMIEGKWFSILRKENPLAEIGMCVQQSNGAEEKDVNLKNSLDASGNLNVNGVTSIINTNPTFSDNYITCSKVLLTQGNKWDVFNNLHLFSNPNILFSANSTQNQLPNTLNTFYHADCTLTMSGLDEEMIDASLNPKHEAINESGDNIHTLENGNKEDLINHLDGSSFIDQITNNTDNLDSILIEKSLNKIVNTPMCKTKTNTSLSNSNSGVNTPTTTTPNNCTQGVNNMNLTALTAYVSCDSPAPLQMTQEESEQLENCKINGLPKKLEGNYVPKDLRYGWWRVTDTDQLKEILGKLHMRGVREKELHNSFMMSLVQTNNKLQIEKGDLLATELSISHLDRVIALNGGFPSPDSNSSFSVKTARRIDQTLLEQVEALEERVAAASMQVKGWKPPPRSVAPSSTPPHNAGDEAASTVAVARCRLLALEAAIERRYLRPPLGAGAPPPAIQTEQQERQQHQQDKQKDGDERESPALQEPEYKGSTSTPRGLAVWREGTSRCQTSAQLAMVLHALEAAIAWDKSIMKANCQFCQSGDSEDKLLLCDGCDKGYHTYCFKPKMEKIPDGDWYCYECLNKATGERVCIVCGGKSGSAPPGSTKGGRLIPCALCPRAYHQDCHYPPLNKVPRGKWYCVKCIVRAPPKKPRSAKKAKTSNTNQGDSYLDNMQPPSPAPSQASTTTTIEDCPITSAMMNQSSLSSVQSTPEKHFQQNLMLSESKHFAAINNLNSMTENPTNVPNKNSTENQNDLLDFVSNDKDKIFYDVNMEDTMKNNEQIDSVYEDFKELDDYSEVENNILEKRQLGGNKLIVNNDDAVMDGEASCGTMENDSNSGNNSEDYQNKGLNMETPSSPTARDREMRHSKKDRGSHKRMNKELAPCKALLEEMELHDDSWPFLLPVNTKQFPTYKKVIRTPMDLSTIKRKLQDLSYKTKEEFACDVRQIFHNCEVFNEDESPVGRAGHGMRRFFEERWANV